MAEYEAMWLMLPILPVHTHESRIIKNIRDHSHRKNILTESAKYFDNNPFRPRGQLSYLHNILDAHRTTDFYENKGVEHRILWGI